MSQTKPKHRVPAVSNDTKGGKSAMSIMNPQKPDSQKQKFRGVRVHDKDEDTWHMGETNVE